MSPNLHKPHLLVIAEDEANRSIVNGFATQLEANPRQFYIETVSRGWTKGRDRLLELCDRYLKIHTGAHALLIIDFDQQADRASEIKDRLPSEVRDRVFIIGVFSEPEALKRSTKKKGEEIGQLVAAGCKAKNSDIWEQEPLLIHNLEEIQRLSQAVRDLFFEDS